MKTLGLVALFVIVLALAGVLFKFIYETANHSLATTTNGNPPKLAPTPTRPRSPQTQPKPRKKKPSPTRQTLSLEDPFGRRKSGRGDRWTSFDEATDHVAAEILDALETRPTLVIWLFDRTESAAEQRQKVTRRFEDVYRKFDELQTKKHPAFRDRGQPPLLTVVGAFAESTEFLTPEPTADSGKLIQAASSLQTSSGGDERTFGAIEETAKKYGDQRDNAGRLVLLVVVSDERGDDPERLDPLVIALRKMAIALYVIGVPAPFGSQDSLAMIPQNEGSQPIHQGPESLNLEVVHLGNWEPIDSGFASFALSRLALESGGKYLAVGLPNGYNPQVMAELMPDYLSRPAYDELWKSNKASAALIEAAKQPPLELPAYLETQFRKQDEASLKRQLDRAQRDVARAEPKLRALYPILESGLADRPRLTHRRWKAGFDLAVGRVAAARARIEGYNAALAQLKAGRAFPDPAHTTWELKRTEVIQGDSSLEKLAQLAHQHLERVKTEHPGSPWAKQATRELSEPMGWEWSSK